MKNLTILISILSASLIMAENAGPVFITKQKSSVAFLNTEGTKLDCLAHGDPDPETKWYRSLTNGRKEQIADIPSIRKIYSNGSMVLKRFSPNQYLQDVHATVYRCSASNVHGRIISVPVSVRAITKRRKQQIQAQVYDEYVIKGNTAVLRCHIPTFFKDYLEVTAWVREDNHVISRDQQDNNRYTVTETGNLHIRTSAQDQELGYWCQVKNRFTGETFLSQTAGRIKLTEPRSTVLPTITDMLHAADVKKGKSIQLSCAAQGYPLPKYRWMKPDGTEISGTDGLLTVTDTATPGSFEYRCIVSNSNGEDSKSTLLIVREKLNSFITQRMDDNGNRIELTCHTSGYPILNILWTLNGEQINGVLTQKDKGRIVINKAGRKHRGMYQCFVSNKWEVIQSTLQLKLGDFAPSFLKTFKIRTLQPGPSIELECSGIGHPDPAIEWIRNGNRIFKGELNIRIKETVGKDESVTSRLTVKNIRVEDGGEYSCKLSNKLGSDTYSERINVYGLPVVHKINNITVGQGQFVKIQCYVSGFPIKNINWSRADSRSYMPRTSKSFRNGTLIITEIAKKDQGQYKCKARNGGGQSDSRIVNIKVLLRPKIDLPLPLNNLPEGGSVSLICTVVQGDDPMKLSWKKNGKTMKFDKGTDITSTKLYTLIQIRNLNYSHSGNYTCSAENPAGTAEKTVKIEISVSPKWKKEPRDVIANVGKDIRITCTGSGIPEASTEWLKIDNIGISPINESNSKYKFEDNKATLVIRNINKSFDDKSRYRCVVTNGVMPDLVKEITVNVATVSFRMQKLPTHSTVYNGTKWLAVCNIDHVKSKHASGIIKMMWMKDAKVLTGKSSKRIKLQQGRNDLRLVVNPLKFEDEGTYACQVSVDKLTKSSTTRLTVLPQGIERFFSIGTPTVVQETTKISSKPTESQVIVPKETDYVKENKQRQSDAVVDSVHEIEQDQFVKMKKGNNNNSKNNRQMKMDSESTTNINQIVIFVVPAVVVIILLIAVVSTIIAYVVLRRTAKKDRCNSQLYRHPEDNDTRDNEYARRKENVLFTPSSTNSSVDRRYGRLKSSSLKYGEGDTKYITQNTYEIPDYCGGIKPYSTLQISHNASKKSIDGNNRNSQCSV